MGVALAPSAVTMATKRSDCWTRILRCAMSASLVIGWVEYIERAPLS
jgi:hypothetical protein